MKDRTKFLSARTNHAVVLLATLSLGSSDGFSVFGFKALGPVGPLQSRGTHHAPIVSVGPALARGKAAHIGRQSPILDASETAADSVDIKKAWSSDFPLSRPHERSIFLFYSAAGAGLISLGLRGNITASQVESTLCLVWTTFVLAVSFLEAWVKFKAPFLRRHVAVDVGRLVFAALNAAELALAGSLWASRCALGGGDVSAACATGTGCLQRWFCPAFILPSVATLALAFESIWVSPRLYFRAKAKIVKGFEEGPPQELTADEEAELGHIAKEVEGRALPSAKWHGLYGMLELTKVLSLLSLAFLMRG